METLERTLSFLFHSQRGHDAKLFPTSPAFASFPKPSLTITSPDCGASGSMLDITYTADGDSRCPSLSWSLPETIPASEVKEYLIMIQDADVPIPTPIMHAAFYHIAPSITAITPDSLVPAPTDEPQGKGKNMLKGGFKYAKTLRGVPYVPPRPLRGHGPHRYFFYVVALKEGLGEGLSVPAKKDEIARACEGKVLGWGEWIGVAERK
jgi:phosphatidylethanolamine-binding protein (PEBP) family uncharacterized protein